MDHIQITLLLSGLLLVSGQGNRCQHNCQQRETCQVSLLNYTCYYIFTNQKMTWDENKQLCASLDLTMFEMKPKMIENGSLPDFIRYVEKHDNVWSGGNAKDLGEKWVFVNGVPLDDVDLLMPENYRDDGQPQQCGTMLDDQTIDKTDCRDGLHFICRFDDWHTVPAVYLSEIPVTWFEAQSQCTSLGGNLFYLKAGENFKFLKPKLSLSPNKKWYIGIVQTLWQWEDGENIAYFNWNDHEPDTVSQNCIGVSSATGKWISKDCNEELLFAVCQEEASDTETSFTALQTAAVIVLVLGLLLLVTIVIYSVKKFVINGKCNTGRESSNSEEGTQGGAQHGENLLRLDTESPYQEDPPGSTDA